MAEIVKCTVCKIELERWPCVGEVALRNCPACGSVDTLDVEMRENGKTKPMMDKQSMTLTCSKCGADSVFTGEFPTTWWNCRICGASHRIETAKGKHDYILQKWPRHHATMLYRASDGIQIGLQEKNMVIWGDVPNKRQSHMFIDEEHAAKWLRENVTKMDVDNVKFPESCRTEPLIEEVFGEGSGGADGQSIIIPELEMPGVNHGPVAFRKNYQ